MITITLQGHNLWSVARDGKFAGALRWQGEHMRLVDPEGGEIGTLYRSDGTIGAHEIGCPSAGVNFPRVCDCPRPVTYTWRAYAADGRPVALRAEQSDAVAALLVTVRPRCTHKIESHGVCAICASC